MNKKYCTFLAAAASAIAVSASPYIGAGINYSRLDDADEGGYSVEGVLGFGVAESLRIEGALGYDSAEAGNVDIDLWSIFANLYYDFNLDGAFTPYILGGLGYSSVKVESFSSEGSFAGQLGAGIGFSLTEKLIIDLKYRYMMSQEYLDTFNFNAHQLGLGLRYHF